jgi:hypothetical protein
MSANPTYKRLENAVANAIAQALKEQDKRIECASCHKAPTDDPTIALARKNVKGVKGVFLCQWCDQQAEEIARLKAQAGKLARSYDQAYTENMRLRAALQAIAGGDHAGPESRSCGACQANEALRAGEENT